MLKRINVEKVLIFIVVFIVIAIRISWFDKHFAHCDDIEVAKTLISLHNDAYSEKMSFLTGVGKEGTILNMLSVSIYYLGKFIFGWLVNDINSVIKFSSTWTYAPGQFLFTNLLLTFGQNYDSILFWGRIPSLIVGCLSLYLVWYYGKILTKNNIMALLGVCLLGFSWQSIIYCMHMSNYEIIIAIGFITLIGLHKYTRKIASTRKNVLPFIILGVLTYFHYQTIFYFCAFIVTMFIIDFIEKDNLKNNIIRYTISGITYTLIISPLLYFAVQRNLGAAGVHWNAGVDQEYLFRFTNIANSFKFFVINGYKVFRAMLSPVFVHSKFANTISIILCLIFIIGIIGSIIGFIKNKEKYFNNFITTLFIVVTLLLQCFVVIIGKATLSPTRHSNFLIPIFIAGILLGISIFYKIFDSKKIIVTSLVLLLSFAILSAFLLEFNDIKYNREDKFSQKKFDEMITNYDPAIIVSYNWTSQIWGLLYNNPYYYEKLQGNFGQIYVKKNIDKIEDKDILFISHRGAIDDKAKEEILNILSNNKIISNDEIQKKLLKNNKSINVLNSNVEIDFDDSTKNGTNGLYIYLSQ